MTDHDRRDAPTDDELGERFRTAVRPILDAHPATDRFDDLRADVGGRRQGSGLLPLAPADPGRWRPRFGPIAAAAAVVALLGGLAFVAQRDDDDDGRVRTGPPPTEAATTSDPRAETSSSTTAPPDDEPTSTSADRAPAGPCVLAGDPIGPLRVGDHHLERVPAGFVVDGAPSTTSSGADGVDAGGRSSTTQRFVDGSGREVDVVSFAAANPRSYLHDLAGGAAFETYSFPACLEQGDGPVETEFFTERTTSGAPTVVGAQEFEYGGYAIVSDEVDVATLEAFAIALERG